MKKTNLALALGAAMVAGSVMPAFADGEATPFATKLTVGQEVGTQTVASTDKMEDGATISQDANKNSVEEVEYQTIENPTAEQSTQSATVYAKVGSSFKVTIPKVIVLKGVRNAASTATYKVDVDGDIAGDEYVLVQPASTFAMKQAGKADVEATVAQELVKYRAYNYTTATVAGEAVMAEDQDDAIAAGEGTGTVSATLTAGKWNGSFDFDIRLVNETEAAANNN